MTNTASGNGKIGNGTELSYKTMKNKIYIQKFIEGKEENLPKEDGHYIVKVKETDPDLWYEYFDPDDKDQCFTWLYFFMYLLPVEIPSKNEIEGEAMTYSSYPAMPDGHPEFDIMRANDFDAGVNWLLNKLLGK